MGYNSVVSGHLKSTGIPWVDGLPTGPLDLGRHSHTIVKERNENGKCKELGPWS